jgi:hypothetical protein
VFALRYTFAHSLWLSPRASLLIKEDTVVALLGSNKKTLSPMDSQNCLAFSKVVLSAKASSIMYQSLSTFSHFTKVSIIEKKINVSQSKSELE